MTNFTIRTISGALFVILVIGSVLLHPFVFAAVIGIVAIMGLYEYLNIVRRDEMKKFGILTYLTGGYLYFSVAFYAHRVLMPYNDILIFLNLPLFCLLFISELYNDNEKPYTRISKSMTGILYVCLPMALLNFLYYPDFQEHTWDPVLLVLLFSLIWINDTFAYITGSLVGKHHLFPSISPKKTWEGSLGGAVVTLLAAWVIAGNFTMFNVWEWIIFAVIVIVFGTFGDLVESMLKRSYNIKDSGNIIPGHGGILDRFDATLGVAPVAFVFLQILWLL